MKFARLAVRAPPAVRRAATGARRSWGMLAVAVQQAGTALGRAQLAAGATNRAGPGLDQWLHLAESWLQPKKVAVVAAHFSSANIRLCFCRRQFLFHAPVISSSGRYMRHVERACRAPPAVRGPAHAAWARRWWSILSVAVQRAVGHTALGRARAIPGAAQSCLDEIMVLAPTHIPSRLPWR